MIKEPIYQGILQSDLDFAGHNPINLTGWPPAGGGGGGTDSLITVSVKDAPYNATGDGVTDDTAAIQAAINAVGALGGGVVFFPKGVYLCNGAFDASTNSILKFPPFVLSLVAPNELVVIELRGETPQSTTGHKGSVIKTTKTGTGSHPSLLAAYPYLGRAMPGSVALFSYLQPVIRNLTFEVATDPSMDGVRLDTVVNAIVEDVVITAADQGAAAPTHGTVGLWMPATLNFGTSFVERVWVLGFDTGMVASVEHFRCPQVCFLNCKVACEFLSGGLMAWANVFAFHCNSSIKFTVIDASITRCPIILNLDEEYQTSGWQARTTDILDSSNAGSGEVRHWIWSVAGNTTVSVTGGANLRLMDAFSPRKGIVPAGGTTGQVLKKLSNADYDYGWG